MKRGNIKFLHAHHRLADGLGLGGRSGHLQVPHLHRRDLPGDAEAVDQPAAHQLAPAFRQGAPEPINLGLPVDAAMVTIACVQIAAQMISYLINTVFSLGMAILGGG